MKCISKIDPMYTNIWGIYKILNITNNKVYIGSSKNLYKRIRDHFRDLRKGTHINGHLQRSFNKYGEDSFKVEVLKTILYDEWTDRDLRDLETKFIELYKSYNQDFGYNRTRVGTGTTTENFTEERKHKISEALKGREAHNKGIPMSNKQKRLLKEINSKKFGKEVLVYDMIGNLVYEFQTIHETNRVLGIPRSSISSMCVGNSGRYHNYILRFKGEKDPGRSHFIKKPKNISYTGPFYFYIENITNPIDRKIFINKVSIERYIGLYNKDKKFQKGFKELLTKTDDDFIIIKNYKIRFIYALSDSNIAKEVRQSGLVPEVIE